MRPEIRSRLSKDEWQSVDTNRKQRLHDRGFASAKPLSHKEMVLIAAAVAFGLAAVGLPDSVSVLLVIMSGIGAYMGLIVQEGASAKAGMYGMGRIAAICFLTEGIIEMGYIMSIGVDS